MRIESGNDYGGAQCLPSKDENQILQSLSIQAAYRISLRKVTARPVRFATPGKGIICCNFSNENAVESMAVKFRTGDVL